MVGERRIYQGQVVQVMGIVNGDEVVVQMPDGSRQPVYRRDLSELPKPESNRPITTKGAESQASKETERLPAPPAPPAEVPPTATESTTQANEPAPASEPTAPPADPGASQ